jgi:excisionase family DNA binding protein
VTTTLSTPTGLSPHELRLALRINDACVALGISRSSLYELMAAGEIKTAVIAGRRLIPVSELERLVRNGTSKAA